MFEKIFLFTSLYGLVNRGGALLGLATRNCSLFGLAIRGGSLFDEVFAFQATEYSWISVASITPNHTKKLSTKMLCKTRRVTTNATGI